MSDYNRGGSSGRSGGGFGSGRGRGGRDSGRRDNGGGRGEMFRTTCDECGVSCEVPFKPSNDKPVYCSDCFRDKNDSRDNDRSFDRNDRSRGRRDSYDNSEKRMYEAVCGDCGKTCEVPFKPTNDRPVYCDDCFITDKNRPKQSNDYKMELDSINEKLDMIIKFLEIQESKKPIAKIKLTKNILVKNEDTLDDL